MADGNGEHRAEAHTLFDRAVRRLTVQDIRALSLEDGAVVEAADYLGLPGLRGRVTL